MPWNAPSEAVRAAYIDAAKVFHPDRYAGKRLGSYRSRLEKVFRRVTEARDTLCDETRRAAYVRETAPATEFTKAEARRLEDERRSAERRARLARQNPLVARASRVADLVSRGRQAMQAGNFVQAANDLLLAQSMDPSNPGLGTLAAEAKRKRRVAAGRRALRQGAGGPGHGHSRRRGRRLPGRPGGRSAPRPRGGGRGPGGAGRLRPGGGPGAGPRRRPGGAGHGAGARGARAGARGGRREEGGPARPTSGRWSSIRSWSWPRNGSRSCAGAS